MYGLGELLSVERATNAALNVLHAAVGGRTARTALVGASIDRLHGLGVLGRSRLGDGGGVVGRR